MSPSIPSQIAYVGWRIFACTNAAFRDAIPSVDALNTDEAVPVYCVKAARLKKRRDQDALVTVLTKLPTAYFFTTRFTNG